MASKRASEAPGTPENDLIGELGGYAPDVLRYLQLF
jgi:hypothetical protein